MLPILFHVGPYPIYAYGVFITLGLITLYAIALRPARRAGREWEELLPMAAGVMVGGVVGARLSHILVEPERLIELLDFYSLFRPGTPGNIIGLMIGGYVGGLVVRESLGVPSLGNYYAPALAAASAVWRVGCTLGGCCYGKETDLPWAVHLADADRHPTMIYEGLFNLALFFVLRRLRHRLTGQNALLFAYFASYAGFRFFLEFIRLYPPVAFNLTGAQLICLGILAWQGLYWQRQLAGRGVEAQLTERAV